MLRNLLLQLSIDSDKIEYFADKYGLLVVVLLAYSIYGMWLIHQGRSGLIEKLNERERYEREKLESLVKETSKAITECTIAIQNLKK